MHQNNAPRDGQASSMDCLFPVGRIFTGLFHEEDDEIYKEKEDEILPDSYQRACRD